MHLAQRGRRRRLRPELGETGLPLRPKLRHHTTFDKCPAHRRRVGLQRGQLGRVFFRQRVGHRAQELRHLHHRAFQPAQYGLEVVGMRRLVGLDAEQALPGDARRDAAHRAGCLRHAAKFAEDGIFSHRSVPVHR